LIKNGGFQNFSRKSIKFSEKSPSHAILDVTDFENKPGRFFLKIDWDETFLSSIPESCSDISGHVTHGENFECAQVLSPWHLILHRPCDRHPLGQTAAQYAPEHAMSRPFAGSGGLSPQSCHCLLDLL